jgi:hypothetical protein
MRYKHPFVVNGFELTHWHKQEEKDKMRSSDYAIPKLENMSSSSEEEDKGEAQRARDLKLQGR